MSGNILQLILLNLILIFLSISQSSELCPEGTFGRDCQGVCHCLNGADFCSAEDGKCKNMMCSHGWTNPPLCQSKCPDGTFGFECMLTCRCPPMDVCNSLNGLCSSGSCLQGWTGPSCQIKTPRLKEPPLVLNDTLTSKTVKWPHWIAADTGLGDGPISAYQLEKMSSISLNNWMTETVVPENNEPDWFMYTVHSLRPQGNYKFRITLQRKEGDKSIMSDPGEPTDWIKIDCQNPTGVVTDIEATHDAFRKAVLVRWKPPDSSTSNCNRIASFDVGLSCRSVCNSSWLNIPNDENDWSAYIGYSGSLNNNTTVMIRVVNDAGLVGPYSPSVAVTFDTTSKSTTGKPEDSISERITTEQPEISSEISAVVVTEEKRGAEWSNEQKYNTNERESQRYNITMPPVIVSQPQTRTFLNLPLLRRDQTSIVVQPSASVEQSYIIDSSYVEVAVKNVVSRVRTVWQYQQDTIIFLPHGKIGVLNLEPCTQYEIVVTVLQGTIGGLNAGTTLTAHVWTAPTMIHADSDQQNQTLVSVVDVTSTSVLIELNVSSEGKEQAKGNTDSLHQNLLSREVVAEKDGVNTVRNSSRNVIRNIFMQDKLIQGYLVVVDDIDSQLDTDQHLRGAINPDSLTKEGAADVLLPYREARLQNRSYYVAGWIGLNQTQYVVGDGQFSVPGEEEPLPYWLYSDINPNRTTIYEDALPEEPDLLDTFIENQIWNYRTRYGSNRNKTVRVLGGRTRKNLNEKLNAARVVFEGRPSPLPMYHNVPLLENSSYSVWLIREDRVNGVAVRSFPLDGGVPFITRPFVSDTSGKGSAISTKVAIVLVFFCLLLIVALLGVIVCYMRRRRKNLRAQVVEASDFPPVILRHNTMSPFAYRSMDSGYLADSMGRSKLIDPNSKQISGINGKYQIPNLHMVYGIFPDAICSHQIPTSDIRRYAEYGKSFENKKRQKRSASSSPARNGSTGGSPERHSVNDENKPRWLSSNIDEEFVKLPTCFTDSINVANLPGNTTLNRISYIVPYDRNRVSVAGQPTYVNASRVRTLGSSSCIVTQCPFDEPSALQFWRLMWQRRPSDIVMLMNIDKNSQNYLTCGRYWPLSPGDVAVFGRFEVRLTFQMSFSFYTYREISVINLDETKENNSNNQTSHSVRHWQFTAWQKNDRIPYSPLLFLLFVRRVRDVRACLNADLGGVTVAELRQRCKVCYDVENQCGSELVVHCLDGGGASGLYVALDMLLTQGYALEYVDVLGCVASLRCERVDLVSTVQQYRFLYACVVEEFSYKSTRLFPQKFSLMFDGLERCGTVIASLNREHELAARISTNNQTNLNQTALYIENEEEYIAVSDRFLAMNGFIAMTCNLVKFRNVFWTVVADNDVSCIVMLNKMCDSRRDKKTGSAIDRVLPQCGKTVSCAEYTISCVTVKVSGCFIVYGLTMSIRRQGFTHDSSPTLLRNLVLYEFTEWPANQEVPAAGPLLDLLDELRNVIGQNEQLLAFSSCEQVRDRAGLLCSLWWGVEQCDYEEIVDVFSTVRVMRDRIPHAINTGMKYQFLHTALREHIRRNSSRDALSDHLTLTDHHRPSLRFLTGTSSSQISHELSHHNTTHNMTHNMRAGSSANRAFSFPIVHQRAIESPKLTSERMQNPAYQPILPTNVEPCSRNMRCSLDTRSKLLQKSPDEMLIDWDQNHNTSKPEEQVQGREPRLAEVTAVKRPNRTFMSPDRENIGKLQSREALLKEQERALVIPFQRPLIDLEGQTTVPTHPPFHSPVRNILPAASRASENGTLKPSARVDPSLSRVPSVDSFRMGNDRILNSTEIQRTSTADVEHSRALLNNDDNTDDDDENDENDDDDNDNNGLDYHLSEAKIYTQKNY